MSAHFDDDDFDQVEPEASPRQPGQESTAAEQSPPALIQIGPLDV